MQDAGQTDAGSLPPNRLAGSLTVTAVAVPEGAAIRISDTGVGIPEGEMERIFEPFHTLRAGGSGMGLSIAHTIVTDHGGRIEVASKVGEGTFARPLPDAI